MPLTLGRNSRFGTRLASVLLVIATAETLITSGVHATEAGAAASLKQLFEESNEATLRRNPFTALERGDLRYADRLGYDLSDAYFSEERSANRSDLDRLHRIDRTALTAAERIEYDAFEWEKKIAYRALEPRYLDLTKVLPIESFTGFHLDYADLASGNGGAPFTTETDYEDNLARHLQYGRYIDSVIGRLKEGAATGIVQPRLLVEKVIRQLDVQLKDGGQAIFNGPVHKFPATISQTERAKLLEEYGRVTQETLVPALRRLRDYLQHEYLPRARRSIGLSQMRGGAALYSYLIEVNTTLPLSADAIHRLGLAEVARIQDEMREIQRRVGFAGTLHDFFEHIRTDPSLRAGSVAEVQKEFERIRARIMTHLTEQFANPPTDRLEILPEPSYKEDSAAPRLTGASGYYQGGSPDGTHPGVFFFVVGTTPEMDTVFLHEAIPGHHLQGCIAKNNRSLPEFLRFDGPPAYLEGWALYAETLWRELGVESDPYRRFGGLNAEMVRAQRLVVDTGIHALGWTREQAVRYMLKSSAIGREEAESAVDRYVATPGQALAYKVGEQAILRLKRRAQETLGTRFDPRAFHGEVLNTGALPLPVLEEKIDIWLEGQQARR